MKDIYRIKNLHKTYNFDNRTKKVFADLSLDIDNKEITVLVGKSGCGKTTLLRMIADLEKIDSGSIDFYNNQGIEEKPKVGFVFQDSRLFPWLNVLKNIEIHGRKGDKYLKMVALEGYKNAYPKQLSGGMAQRVAIARALAYEPDTLLMDEPFSALDYFTRNQLLKEILKIHMDTGIGIIFVTHNIDEALMLGKKIVVIKNSSVKEYKVSDKYPRNTDSEELKLLRKEILHDIEN
ncbi:Aliphatic sulfonates import ATP-binding protein SsuB [Fusobacterium sp. DD29]|uniref:ABC transporter ATP-binding protein n=1 Tax=unclassified Fusobacterium TaxID=2648384 RepID=UPI001B8A9544|nr:MULTISPECIES: ABC transporter ATP-binding protein [unclassified Fusobacterium]MBR8701750.1 Aliphatic sulfonates import ATP-binding protein SsuB [Fusobacterium sp. DD45]MBR8711531.1 Aliphatic sulfonates import ATP-binding protein SsuB [Fusobacterium sp. DD28]MBR8749928.1 Aliphatic sulfonates import ATP-binding protein SsuB [Fusobacterium sp. DD29]MBR8752080.1 Aliphatic sulfonates import ATP-binding protein SsuB [Fusobacterium sp. DD26]MBR8762170.1 Aliphatic sulfonates import ATP-binding prot